MEAEEIDKLNDDIISHLKDNLDVHQLWKKYLKDEMPENMKDIEDEEKLEKALMMKIENGDYDYFWQLITQDHSDLIYLMRFSSKTDDIKILIENGESLWLSPGYVTELIKATHDPNYIKSCIADREKLRLDLFHVAKLIKATQDPNYIKSCIADREKLGLDSYAVSELIKATQDPYYIKSCIADRNNLGLNSYAVSELIKATQDPYYIKSCIADREKLGLVNYAKALILGIHDIDCIKSCIEDRENLGLDPDWISMLIKATQDLKYIESCIRDRVNLELDSCRVSGIIISTHDSNFIKRCIADRNNLGLDSYAVSDLIIATQDQYYIRNCIVDRTNLGLNTGCVIELINSIRDPYCIKSCIADRENLGLDSEYVIKLINKILKIKNIDSIKSCIADSQTLGLDSYTVSNLILATCDPDYIKKCIADRENLKLDSYTVSDLILATHDLDYIKSCIANREIFNLQQTDIKKLSVFIKKVNINLPPEMTIGVEIETEGEEDNSEIIEKFLTDTNWKARGDGSLISGTEIVSPILTGNPERSSDEIRKICALLNGVGQTTSERCGGHIHIGADYLTSKQDWVNLIQIWANAEEVLYTICNEKGSIPREGVPQYAQPISKKLEEALKAGTISLDGEEDLYEFADAVATMQGDRYFGINFLNVGRCDKNTIEFRLPNGTINPNTWIENINLFGGIVRSAHELSEIQTKPETQITETERNMLNNFEILQTEENEEQLAKALIELSIAPEYRHIYMDRYTTNKLLLDEFTNMKYAITRLISTNKIGKKVFTEKNGINGEDYQKSAALIEKGLEEERTSNIK